MLAYLLPALAMMGTEKDLTTIPADERIAYVEKLVDRFDGLNAANVYAKAEASYVYLFDLSSKAPSEDYAAYEHVDFHLVDLSLIDQWTTEERRIIQQWLKANSKTLGALKRAVRRERCFRPLAPDGGRLHASAYYSFGIELMRFGKLMRVAANACALDGNWDEAYKWNLRVHAVADHAYQLPFEIQRLTAIAVERAACEQTLNFLQRHPPNGLREVMTRISEGDDRRCTASTLDEAETLWTLDYIEAWHEWAQNPDKHADLAGMAEAWLNRDDQADETRGLFGNSPFRNVEELRVALRATSAKDDWQAYLQSCELAAQWATLPFHEAWRGADGFRQKYCDLILDIPSLGLFGCGALGSTQSRLLREEARMCRTALSCVVALHEYRDKHGKWPRALSELVPGFLKEAPIDPYSGRPFVYRVEKDGTEFTLYSVADNQVDDGGTHAHELTEKGDRVFWPPPMVTIERDQPVTGD